MFKYLPNISQLLKLHHMDPEGSPPPSQEPHLPNISSGSLIQFSLLQSIFVKSVSIFLTFRSSKWSLFNNFRNQKYVCFSCVVACYLQLLQLSRSVQLLFSECLFCNSQWRMHNCLLIRPETWIIDFNLLQFAVLPPCYIVYISGAVSFISC